MQKQFHLRVRAVIRSGESVLLVRTKGCGHSFLPGGHHEVGETLAQTIVREIQEELGVKSTVKNYLGIVENSWPEGDEYQYEINHVFEVEVKGFRAGVNPVSAEEKLEFFWAHPEEFESVNFLPTIMWPLITNWSRGDKRIWNESNFE